ncbi:Protein kinase domain-containing protein [Mycena sanguinolenta]|uniref:Protein kinase domain-containing protein n=1 Tax=Mycena sanguinolenta TaxID=230812 RepID=A0A8H7DM95_9AGAR|nr:Protein kinase domain-containing protein [Mycena sanguinolenta]
MTTDILEEDFVPPETPFSINALDALESKIKYRLWFIAFVWHMADKGTTPVFENILNETSVFWLEDEDEDYIKEFARNCSAFNWIPFDCAEALDWDEVFKAQRIPRATAAANPLVRLTPQIRLRFVAWLIVAGPVRKDRILEDEEGFPSIAMLVRDWSKSTAQLSDFTAMETCNICSVSHLLPVWVETLSQIYSSEDLKSLPWSGCDCLTSQLSAYPPHPVVELEKDSPVLHILYELVVPLWVLIHWVTFRTSAVATAPSGQLASGSPPFHTFFDMIRGTSLDHDIFSWDVTDQSKLCRRLLDGVTRPTLYPQDWNGYMVEIPFGMWLEISNITKIAVRPRRTEFDYASDLRSRLAAVFLKYSCTPLAFQKILAPFANIDFEHSRFDFVTRMVDPHDRRSIHTNLGSSQFWVTSNLEQLLMTRRENLCRSIWNSSPLSAVERMEDVLDTLPQNLTIYLGLRSSQPFHSRPSDDNNWKWGSGFLAALSHYCTSVKSLLDAVKELRETSDSTHTVARDIYEHMYNDLSAVVARLVIFLRNQGSYRKFLACRGPEAQRLLDFLQDLLDLESFSAIKLLMFQALRQLSRPSGLHPRCFALSGLQRLGQQVTGGGFGDIWKGLIGGQNVCVKVMRIFGDSNITAALKEFGREAVIWRQLYHPNVLPFFGLYYLEDRLCLVSPWMGNGHVIEFIKSHKPADTKRLTLILDVALGLRYLHGQKVVHGDLKGLNILVTPSHRACIADFGVSSIADSITVRFTHSTVTARAGTARYQAPELFRMEDPAKIHDGSDIYAFACVCYEILTCQVPFHELQNDMAVMTKVTGGHRPQRPGSSSGTTTLDGLWNLMQKCWEGDAEKRPTALKVVEHLEGPSIGATPTPTPFISDWDEKFTSRFRRSVQGDPLLPPVTQIECMLFGEEIAQG